MGDAGCGADKMRFMLPLQYLIANAHPPIATHSTSKKLEFRKEGKVITINPSFPRAVAALLDTQRSVLHVASNARLTAVAIAGFTGSC